MIVGQDNQGRDPSITTISWNTSMAAPRTACLHLAARPRWLGSSLDTLSWHGSSEEMIVLIVGLFKVRHYLQSEIKAIQTRYMYNCHYKEELL